RNSIRDQVFNTFDLKPDQQNILNINPEELVERYLENMDRSIIITYKNKTAKEWNQAIHKRRFPDTGHICSNEKVIVGRNNYHHNIFNGDFGVVIKASSNIDIRRTVPVVHENKKHQVVLEWRHVELLFLDEEQEEKVVKGYMLENFLNTDAPNLSSVEQKALFIDFKIRNSKLKPNTTEFKETISNDQLFNAIMIKYGYAVTCHKAQGGEWDNVFVIWDYNIQKDFNNYSLKDLIKGKTNENFYRWAYTAVTRAEKALYNVNPPFFNPFVNMDFVPSISIDQLRNMHGSKKKVLQIQWEDKHDQLIESLGLKETPDFLQKKAVELHHLLTERYIQIHKREGKPYQEVYTFIRDEKKAKMIFFYNKKNKFTKAKKVPSGTNSDEFYREIENTLNQPLKTEIIKNENTDKTETQYHYTPNFPDDKSFLKALYQKLVVPCKEKNIAIKKIDHIDYRERYEFVQYNGKAILDFVYDGKGFFTIVEEQEHTSPDLIIDLYEIIQNIKQ
ncbi:MAG: ATP-binding domain-containing protein, partial [Bacteroidota bacterium]